MRLLFVVLFSVGVSSVSHAQDAKSKLDEGIKQAQAAMDSIPGAPVNTSPTDSLIAHGTTATQNDQTSASKPAQGAYAAADPDETARPVDIRNTLGDSGLNLSSGNFEDTHYFSDEQRAAHSRYPKAQEDRLKSEGTEVCKQVDEASKSDPRELRYCVDAYRMYFRPGSSIAKANPSFIKKDDKPVTIFWADSADQPEGSFQCKSEHDGYFINCKRGIRTTSPGVADTNNSNQLKGAPETNPIPRNPKIFEQMLGSFLPPPAK